MSKKIVYNILFVALIIFLGFTREFIFENINTKIKFFHLTNDLQLNVVDYTHSFFDFLNYSTTKELTFLKWLFTFIYTEFFLLITSALLLHNFKSKQSISLAHIMVGSIFTLSLLIYTIGVFILHSDNAYSISRSLMEFVQSPIIIMLALPAWYLYEKEIKMTNQSI